MSRFSVKCRIVTVLALLLGPMAADCRSAEPYVPKESDPVLEPWRWRRFPELLGLGARCMAEDHEGNMWFGISDGVVRYDGLNWVTFEPEDGLLGKPVNAVAIGLDGSVYAGSPRGISRYNDRGWQPVFPASGGTKPSMPWVILDLLAASDGSLWAGTVYGALRLCEGRASLYTTSSHLAGLRVLAPGLELVSLPEGTAPVRHRTTLYGAIRPGNLVGPDFGLADFLGSGPAPWGVTVVAPGSALEAGDVVLEWGYPGSVDRFCLGV